jgi:hypothetical protein
MSRRTEQEILQEARRILRRLTSPRTGLFARGAGYVVGRSAMSASRVTVADDVVAAFAAQGWIAPDGPGRYVIAPAGQALLARESQDRFAGQHRVMQATEIAGEAVRINVGESPLSRLKFRDLIDGVQFAAGEKLRRDFTLAQLTPRLGVDLSAPVVSGSRGAGADSITDIAMAARQRLNRALAAVGPGLSDLLFDVCCHLAALDTVETARGWSKRSGRVVLKIALDRLASHYGFDAVAQHSPVRAWSAEV